MITNMSNLVLNDAAATPVAHNFVPRPNLPSDGNNIRRWADTDHSNGRAIGFSPVMFKVAETPENFRVTATLAVPTLEVAGTAGTAEGYSAPPRVAYTCRANMEFVFPKRSTIQERKDLVTMIRFLILQGQANTLGDNISEMMLPY